MSTINHLHNEEIAQEIGVFVLLEYYYTSWSLRNFNLMTKILKMQVEQRRKNLFPVQPKPPQGFKDYLMNRKTYLLHENAHERLRSIPMIQPPQSLDGPLKELFKAQEEERYKLRMKHLVEKEKLVLAVEQVWDIVISKASRNYAFGT